MDASDGRLDQPTDPTEVESTESQIVRGADDRGDDTDLTLRGDSGEGGIDEDWDQAWDVSRTEEPLEEET